MTLFELNFALTSVILGLALTQIASNAHRLALAGRRVRWAPEPVLLTLLVILIVVDVWLDQWGERGMVETTVGRALLQVAKMMTLFFAAASCLPEPEPGPAALDLTHYYYRTRGLSYGALIAGLLLFDLYRLTGQPFAWHWGLLRILWLPMLYLLLIVFRWRPLHFAVLLFVLGMFGTQVIGNTLR